MIRHEIIIFNVKDVQHCIMKVETARVLVQVGVASPKWLHADKSAFLIGHARSRGTHQEQHALARLRVPIPMVW
jgi:hypothetical protein